MKLKNRKSIRLKNYDYSSNGYYFVTICVQDKLNLFWGNLNIGNENNNIGRENDNKGRTHRSARTLNHPNLNDIGEMVNYWWNEIPNHFQNIKLDESVIMPNHMHGIIVIQNFIINRADLGNVIQWFKTMVTNEYIKNVKNLNWPRFNKRLWQRNYHERIIRDKRELEIKRLYIRNNPKNWSKKKS